MNVAAILKRLKIAGLAVRPEGGKVIVGPRGSLNAELLELIQAHKAAILEELVAAEAARNRDARPPIALDIERRHAIIAACDASRLDDFRAALVLGRLHLCSNCQHFTFAADPVTPGYCARFDVDALPFVPFWCSGFLPSRVPARQERARR
jgi:hypothetical protein